MPSPSRGLTRIAISQDILARIEQIKPAYMDLTTFINFQLDTNLTLGKPSQPAPGAPVLPSSLKGFIKEEKDVSALHLEEINHPLSDATAFAKAIKEQGSKYTPGFEAFWKVYQSCPDRLRARSQSKPKAFDAYRAALKKVEPADLQQAVQTAVQGQLDAQQQDIWVPSLPDAFRWLKDGSYEVLLEDHTPAQAESRGDRL